MSDKSESDVYEYALQTKKLKDTPLKELLINESTLDTFTKIVLSDLVQFEPFTNIDTDHFRRKIYNLYCHFYDEATYSSFYGKSRTHLTDPLEVLTFVLKSILASKAVKHPDKMKDILTKFFDEKYFYFQKMALYIIGSNINEYSGVFWEALEKDVSNFIFGEIYFGDELKHVLESLPELSSGQKKKLRGKIDQGPGYIPKEEPDKYIARWKQQICRALIKESDFKQLYDSLKSVTGIDVGLHAAVGESIVRSGEGPAPYTKEDILNMSNDELAQKLSTFKTKNSWEGPTVGGLAKLIKECSVEHPEKFTDNLTVFNNTGFIYIYEIIYGIKDAWNNKQDIAWDNIFTFIHNYIDRDDFWEDKFVVEKDDWLGGANHFWIIGATMELINDGTRDASRAYGEEHFDIAEKIIFLIFNKLETEDEEDITDYVTHALNSSHGKTLIALINHALRIARVNEKKGLKEKIKWSDKVKEKYNELLGKKIIESFTLLGLYLPNLNYLDKTWAKTKAKSLYLETVDIYWEAFMDGYLSTGKVYDELYELMIPHYKRGITYDFKNKHDNEHLVQHLALEYLRGKEDINNPESLLRKVLDAWNMGKILDVINFFWSNQKHFEDGKTKSQKNVGKIINCWKWFYDNKYKTKLIEDISNDDKKILSVMGKLAIFLPHINEEYSQWLLLSAPYINENYNSSFFVEYLDKFNDSQSMVYTGKILLKMLEHSIPDFRQDHIRSIVDKLYNHGQKANADDICNIYGMNGYEFLRNTYEKYNRPEK